MEYTVRDALLPTIDQSLKVKSNVDELIKYIVKYADKNTDILLSSNMSKRLIFSESDKEILYKVTNLSAEAVESAIKKSSTIKQQFKTQSNPFYVLCILVMHYFSKANKKNELAAISVYLGYLLYTSSHKGSFKYLPDPDIMEYTINNLSNRFLLKQVGTIQLMIEKTILNAMDGRFKMELDRCSDDDIKNIINALETRISSVVKNIAKEFYDNHKKASGNRIFIEEDNESEDNFHISDNRSYKISRVVDNVTSSIVSDGFDQNNVIKRAISLNPGASAKKLEPMLRTIIDNDMAGIPIMVTDIITLFLVKTPGSTTMDLGTMKFLSNALQIYKSNAQDELTTRIKNKLDEWINIASTKYGKNFISKGKTSIDTYRRTIYTCFIYKIIETVK